MWSGRLPAVRRGNRLLVRRTDLDALTGREQRSLSLAEWAAMLPQQSSGASGTAADLVVEDRERRARR